MDGLETIVDQIKAREEEKAQKVESILANTKTFFTEDIRIEKEPYECPICSGRCEYKIIDPPCGGTRYMYQRPLCGCEEEIREKENAEEKRAEEQMRLRNARNIANIGVGKFLSMTFDTLNALPGLSAAAKAAREWLDTGPHNTGLIFEGTFGCGKTHLAVAIAHELVNRHVKVAFWPGFEILEDIRKSYDKHEYRNEDLCDKLAAIPVLIYDDLGNERMPLDERGDWAREKLFRIFYWRDVNELPTIITTNFTGEELSRKIGMANFSRIIGMCGKPIKITAPDYRAKKHGRVERDGTHDE